MPSAYDRVPSPGAHVLDADIEALDAEVRKASQPYCDQISRLAEIDGVSVRGALVLAGFADVVEPASSRLRGRSSAPGARGQRRPERAGFSLRGDLLR
jgi:hypothetical protein